ncbi:hypothetical protein R3W88_000650 [Solanum pinnatisectum]|uniref:Uncharacterized protein n=1 Tax=Solanum pinnatisectum TaxID=50273 RepID=A0AAV9MGI7_9SOLN|nr:hypothetical protein R3W88_000650 [Solanum pinnatisectum]
MEYVSELQHTDENTHIDIEANLHEVTMNEDGADRVQHNIRQLVPDPIRVDKSVKKINLSHHTRFFYINNNITRNSSSYRCTNPQDLFDSHALLSDSQLPIEIPITKIVTPFKILQSLYLTSFGSNEKGNEKLDDDIRLYFPFEG